MLTVGHKYKVQRVYHTKKDETLLFLTYKSYNNDKGFKNYSFFIEEPNLPFNIGDMVVVDRIDLVDYEQKSYMGKQIINVNVKGNVETVTENKSAIEREVKSELRELPF